MKRLFVVIFLFLLLGFVCNADEIKREGIINKLVTHHLGDTPAIKTETSIFKDSINDFPIDSVCLHQAVRQCNGVKDFIHNFASLVCLFPQGTTSFDPVDLPTYKLDKYEFYATAMKDWLVQQRKLVELVDSFIPYQYRRVTENYSVLNENGESEKYVGVYYFDQEDNLERYFWFDGPKWSLATGMIGYAVNHDFSFIEKMVNLLGFNFNESLMIYLMGDANQEFNKEELIQIASNREKQAKKENQQGTSKSGSHTSTPRDNRTINKTQTQSYIPRKVKFEGPKYIVTKDVCGATYSKSAMDTFTKYAINNNTTGIDYMILSGQLTVLSRDQIVTMVDLGLFISKIQLSNGAIVYTDTENLKKQ